MTDNRQNSDSEEVSFQGLSCPGFLGGRDFWESCAEPEYADTDGLVLLPGNRAIVATWVRAESIWRADCLGRSPEVRAFADVTGYVSAHSVTEAATPARRLALLAAYLGLDWPWLTRRCADLGQHGCAGLIQPPTRHPAGRGPVTGCSRGRVPHSDITVTTNSATVKIAEGNYFWQLQACGAFGCGPTSTGFGINTP